MTDREFIDSIETMATEELFDELENIGCDGYYRDIWSSILVELEHRIKALEQGPAHDMIRAEIENIDTSYYSSVNGVDMTVCADDIKHRILQIIDKYKEDKKPTCGDCKEWGTVNCPETYREPTESDDICDSYKTESEEV